MNKFLEQYPALWVPKVGDRVEIVQVLDGQRNPVINWKYKINDTGTIVQTQSNDRGTEWIYDIYFEKYTTIFPVYREEIELI
jgi:hypothetical protein